MLIFLTLLIGIQMQIFAYLHILLSVCFLLNIFCLVGDSVVNVYINHEKKFAFVEMRTVEEASNAMALDGIIFEASTCKLNFSNVIEGVTYRLIGDRNERICSLSQSISWILSII